jgi:hypothetical protein
VGAAFLVLAGVLWWRGHATGAAVLGICGSLLGLAGIVVPSRLGPVQRGWMGFAHALSKVTTPVFLGVVYFLVMLPVGILLRLLGRNPLKPKHETGSFWIPRADDADRRGTMNNQF